MDFNDMISVIYKCKLCFFEAKSMEILKKHLETHNSCVEVKESKFHLSGNYEPPISITTKGKKISLRSGKRKNTSKVKTINKKTKLEDLNQICELTHDTRSSQRIATKRESKIKSTFSTNTVSENDEDFDIIECADDGVFVVHKKLKNVCGKCMLSFNTEAELCIHVDSHVGNKFKCVMCDYSNQSWLSVNKHMQTHNKVTTYKCEDCFETFASYYSLHNHRRFHHFGGSHKCDKCEFVATSKYLLIRHNLTSHAEIHKCQHCNFTADNKIDVDRHIQLRHEGYICKLCPDASVKFSTKVELSNHAGKIHPGKSLFLCKVCNYVAKLKHHLTKHELVHSGNQPFSCDIPGCDYKSKDNKSLKRHKINHHRKPGEMVCKSCNFVTVDQSEYDVHVAMHEVKAKSYKCQFCDYESANSGSVRRHRITKHTAFEDMRYPCPHCNYKCNMREGLLKHLLTHVKKNELYKCNICENVSGSREELKKHYLDIHKEENPLICQKCTFVTLKPSCLRQHQFSHKSKPFACDYCKFTTTTSALLSDHVTLKHLPLQKTINIANINKDKPTDTVSGPMQEQMNENEKSNLIVTSAQPNTLNFNSPVTSGTANQQSPNHHLNTPFLQSFTTPQPLYSNMEDPIYVVHVPPGSLVKTPNFI